MNNPRNIVDDLAAAVGAAPRGSLPPTEVVAFEVDRDGRVVVTTESGERLLVALDRDAAAGDLVPGALTSTPLLRRLLPEAYRFGGQAPRGVPFYRRSRFVGGQRVVEFLEAGR